MKWTTWLLFGAALAVFAALAAMVGRQSARTPAEFLRLVEKQIASGQFDDETALSNLDLALERAEASGDADLAAQARLARGKVLTRIGSWERAKTDLEEVYQQRGGPREIDELLIDLDTRSGDVRKALVRAEALLAKDPSYASGWTRAGTLHAIASDKALAKALDVCAHSLVPDDATIARPIAVLAASLDPTDPARVARSHQLRSYFGPVQGEDAERALQACDEAATEAAAARVAFTRALATTLDLEALAGMTRLLDRAGRGADAVGLLTAGWRFQDVQSDLACSSQALDTLCALERWRFASEVAQRWLNRQSPAPPSFFLQACRALSASERWGPLGSAAGQFLDVADAPEIPWGFYYLGISHIRQPGLGKEFREGGRFNLMTRFLNANVPIDPEPGARARAWREAAAASRELGDATAEREQLRGALDLEPDADGELWLRLAELQFSSPNAGYRDPEARWAKGMSLLPRRTAELLPRWKELGELELRAAGLDPHAQREEAASRQIWAPPNDASPYELYRLAQVCLEAGDTGRAAIFSRKLLETLPGFLPAIDVAIASAKLEGRERDLVELCVKRVRAVGGDEATAAILRSVEQQSVDAKDALELARGDPERFGRVAIARTLAARGEKARALAMLRELPPAALSYDAKLSIATLELDREHAGEALLVLDGMGRRVASDPELFDLYVRAALRASDDERIGRLIDLVGESGKIKAPRIVAACRELLLGGRTTAARVLLEKLDADAATRSGDVVMLLARCALDQKDEDAFAAFAERAQAFETGGQYEIAELLAAVDGERWDDVASWSNALTESRFKPTPLQKATLAMLADHADLAREDVEAPVTAEPRSPQWRLAQAVERAMAKSEWQAPAYFGATILDETKHFLRGEKEQADPRYGAAMLFATTTPVGQSWARARLESTTKKARGSLWKAYWLGHLARQQEDWVRARAWFGGLLTQHAGFGPAWDALERMPAPADAPPTARIDLRLKRLAAMGSLGGPKHERLLDQARGEAARGEDAKALATLRDALAASPTSFDVQAEIAKLELDAGRVAEALVASRGALANANARNARDVPAVLGRHLELVERASRAVPPLCTDDEAYEELGKLAKTHPDDPRLVVALARRDLVRETNNPSIGVARAIARLSSFRASHARRSLESLAPGSLAAWIELDFEIDPKLADDVLQQERKLEPGSPEAWLLAARALAVQGHVEEALDELAIVARLVPRMGVEREILRWLVTREQKPETLSKAVQTVVESEGLDAADPELVVLRAEGQWVLGSRAASAVVEALAPLEGAAFPSAKVEERWATLYALALTTRGRAADVANQVPADVEVARRVIDAWTTRVRDPYRRDVLQCLKGMCARGSAGAVAARGE